MTRHRLTTVETVFSRNLFDSSWYSSKYPDVGILGMTPEYHFRHFGVLMGRAPCQELMDNPHWRDLLGRPAPAADNELVEAYKIARTGNPDLAISYARFHLPENLAYTVAALEANAALRKGDHAAWLTHLNSYLSHSGIAPIVLGEGKQLLDRLGTEPVRPVTDGPLVSVLMPAWNAQETLFAAANSILAQSWRNLELIIVDDCSKDGTWAVMQKLAASDPRVRILRNEVNVGPYVSKNIAMHQADGEWITGHDADDWAHPERIERQVRFLQEGRHIACLSGMARISPAGEFVRLNKIGGFVHDGVCRAAFISLMVQRHYLKTTLGGWDNVRTSADSEMLHRIEAIEKITIPTLPVVTMLCLDNPQGLTNHAVLGHSENRGVSPIRRQYKNNFIAWHEKIHAEQARIDILDAERRFTVPPEMCVPSPDLSKLLNRYQKDGVHLSRDIEADVILVTNTCFPGGNASSTLDELNYLKKHGISCALIHCPIDNDVGKKISGRYAKNLDIWTHYSEVGKIRGRVLICRHPTVATSKSFNELAPKISVRHAFFVVNNSRVRPNGDSIYDIKDLLDVQGRVLTKHSEICPISSVMREELEAYQNRTGHMVAMSESNWNPTFDLALYAQPPKADMRAPYVIGRHGRDSAEKWLENPDQLLRAYPETADFHISILGGAASAKPILGDLPCNWEVHDFGSMSPYDYLKQLDAFVYFPNSALSEAFGRTIVEAMLAGIPVILPHRFEESFGDLPLYAEAEKVADLVKKLSRHDLRRVQYLKEVQTIATIRFSSQVLARRLAGTGLADLPQVESTTMQLSNESLSFRQFLSEKMLVP